MKNYIQRNEKRLQIHTLFNHTQTIDGDACEYIQRRICIYTYIYINKSASRTLERLRSADVYKGVTRSCFV